MEVIAIVVVYNGMKNNWIQKCFDSILNSTIKVKIIAVNNCSTDDSGEFIKQKYSQVQLIETQSNLGFGGANNLAIKEALEQNAEFVFLLNQDAWVDENTIEILCNKSIKNPNYGIVSPLHLNGKGTALDFNFSKTIGTEHCSFYSESVLNLPLKEIYDIDFICAAAWLLTKKCLKKVGGFSPTFYHYGEDDNYCHRVLYKKMKIGFTPQVKIYHDREDRAPTSYHSKKESLKRMLLINSSNPTSKYKIEHYVKQYSIKLIKALLTFKIRDVITYKDFTLFLLSKKKETNKNYKKSLESNEYLFLDYKKNKNDNR